MTDVIQVSKIIMGAMRVTDRKSAIATFRAGIDAGFTYIDTSPCYCYQDEAENSEAWVGAAVNHPDYRSRVLVSTKCSPGNGGLLVGEEFKPEGGFGVRSVDQLIQVFNQSLTRMGLDRVDYYHLWTTHTMEQFEEAQKPGGWLDGVRSLQDKWDHLGVTTHADSDTIIEFLKTGLFETVTLQFNAINRTRLRAIEYATRQGIKVIVMNPLAGGLLASDNELKELALRYLMLMDNVHLLIGFSNPDEVAYAKWILDTMDSFEMTTEQIVKRIDEIANFDEAHCTACGYCLPCPESINIGESLAYYNLKKYMNSDLAKKNFQEQQWYDGLRIDKCTACGLCASKCPNGLDVPALIADAAKLLYDK